MSKELGDDAAARGGYARVRAQLDKGHGVFAEVAHERLKDPSVGWVVQGQAVDSFEAFDVVGDADDREPQHLCSRMAALGSPCLLIEMGKFQVGEQDLDEQSQRVRVVVRSRASLARDQQDTPGALSRKRH